MTQLPFNELDSFAYWTVPGDLTPADDDQTREQRFHDAYQPNHFPTDQLPADLPAALAKMRYVLVGMNPGNAFDPNHTTDFLNFHGKAGSHDSRFAAAVYGTPLWGALMTDLSHKVDSKSTNVDFNKQVVAEL